MGVCVCGGVCVYVCVYREKERFILGNWLNAIGMLTGPKICRVSSQAGDDAG